MKTELFYRAKEMNDFQYNEGHQERNATNEHVRTSGLAVASLVLSILGIHLLGLIFGIIALKKIKRSGGSLTGGGLALAGIIISSVGLLVVIVFVSLLAMSVFAVQSLGKIDQARVVATKANLVALHNAVLQFRMDTGRYLVDEEGLNALIEKPDDVSGWQPGGYLETTELPKDAWEREFIYYLNFGPGKPFVIISLGADGEEGGEGFDADLWSTSRH